ncbi:MAG: tetratricopeptide repeat protein [Candidatus Omnitrophota bacterium]|nr:tetratricopeptide repeat protein [Candidatus Omnitrophota bacterium]
MKRKIIWLVTLLFLSMSSLSYGEQESSKNITQYIREGWQLSAQDKLNEAEASFQKAVDLDPENKEALLGLGKTFMYLDKNNDAEKVFNKLLRLSPNDTVVMMFLAKTYAQNGRYKDSIDLYQKALRVDPKNKGIKIGLAEAYLWAGFRKESVKQYEELLKEDPRNKGVYRGLVETYVWDNRLAEAEDLYLKALKTSPDDIDFHLGLAKIYILMASWSKAQVEYEQVIKIDPKNSTAIKGLENIEKLQKPRQELIFSYLREVDANDWRASAIIYGYRASKLLEHNNNVSASYYVSNNRETGYTYQIGNVAEMGGKYALNKFVDLFGSINMRSYSNGINFFAGGDISSTFKYFQKNTLAFKYNREVFDVFDKIKNNRYIAESSVFLGNYINLNDSFAFNDFSDNNNSIDQYHAFNFSLLKKNPDLNVGVGYRNRDFKTNSPLYYSPQNLSSIVYSVYSGKAFNKEYVYALFKFSENSDHNDTSYYLLGSEYTLSENSSIVGEASYFGTRDKYHALSMKATFRFKF